MEMSEACATDAALSPQKADPETPRDAELSQLSAKDQERSRKVYPYSYKH